jgi:hypothetical protein
MISGSSIMLFPFFNWCNCNCHFEGNGFHLFLCFDLIKSWSCNLEWHYFQKIFVSRVIDWKDFYWLWNSRGSIWTLHSDFRLYVIIDPLKISVYQFMLISLFFSIFDSCSAILIFLNLQLNFNILYKTQNLSSCLFKNIFVGKYDLQKIEKV